LKGAEQCSDRAERREKKGTRSWQRSGGGGGGVLVVVVVWW
jgi:hypothetical protein